MIASLPNSKIAEQVVLSHILLNRPKADIIFDRLSPEMFYSNDYKRIYESACNLRRKNIQINYDSIYNDLEFSTENSLLNYDLILTELVNEPLGSGEIESYLILLLDKYLRRNLILSVNSILGLATDNSLSLETVFDQAEQLLFNATKKKNKSRSFTCF